jgi:hypothetical protein
MTRRQQRQQIEPADDPRQAEEETACRPRSVQRRRRSHGQSQNRLPFSIAIPVRQRAGKLPRGHTDDRLMPSCKTPIWRNDIDALAFQPGEHTGHCMVHRRAFRTLLRAMPSPRECVEFFNAHQEAFQAAARAKLCRASLASTANFHLTSRDVARQLKN